MATWTQSVCYLPIPGHNRDFVRVHAPALRERFPVPGRRALEMLAAGQNPGSGSIILL
jgi:hypothetical protein